MTHPLAKKKLLRLSHQFRADRNSRRQRLAAHLHAAGARPVLEALIAVENGQRLDDVLADFGRVPVSTYRAVGADELQINRPLRVIAGSSS